MGAFKLFKLTNATVKLVAKQKSALKLYTFGNFNSFTCNFLGSSQMKATYKCHRFTGKCHSLKRLPECIRLGMGSPSCPLIGPFQLVLAAGQSHGKHTYGTSQIKA